MTEPYITHYYNSAQQYYVRGRYGEYLGTTDAELASTRYFSAIGQRQDGGPWAVISSHDTFAQAQAQASAQAGGFFRTKATKLEAWQDTFPVPGAEGQFIRYGGFAADLDEAGVPLGLDLRDRVVWLTEAVAIWFGDLRVEDGGPFANTLVEGDTSVIDADWATYQMSGTPNYDPGTAATSAMYDSLSAFTTDQLDLLFIEQWHNRGTGGTWPDGNPVGGA